MQERCIEDLPDDNLQPPMDGEARKGIPEVRWVTAAMMQSILIQRARPKISPWLSLWTALTS
jgi:hypothetical protein